MKLKKKQLSLSSILKRLNKFDEEHAIHIFVPFKLIFPVFLILMVMTGKVGAIISTFMLAFLIFIFLLPDDF